MFDSFVPHTSSLKSMQYPSKNKIIAVKEEGYSSHCNQADNKFASKIDKAQRQRVFLFYAEPRCVSTGMGLTSGV